MGRHKCNMKTNREENTTSEEERWRKEREKEAEITSDSDHITKSQLKSVTNCYIVLLRGWTMRSADPYTCGEQLLYLHC